MKKNNHLKLIQGKSTEFASGKEGIVLHCTKAVE